MALQVVAGDRQKADIWVWSLAQRTLQLLPSEGGLQEVPLWTPDSAQIAYSTLGRGIFRRHADGTGAPESLVQGAALVASGWSADGDLIFNSDRVGANGSIGVLAVGGDRRPKTLLAKNSSPWTERCRRLAYESDEPGRYEIYVRPYPARTAMAAAIQEERKMSNLNGVVRAQMVAVCVPVEQPTTAPREP